jgi:hypothetical protein
MFAWIREKLGLPGAISVCVIALGIVAYTAFGRRDEAVQSSAQRVFICSETMKTFEYNVKVGDKYPVESPYTGRETGWPAERCYWTRDGGAKREPTYVLLNEYTGKEGPTICPDCGRKVQRNNPRPPPSKWRELAEKEKQQAGRSQD